MSGVAVGGSVTSELQVRAETVRVGDGSIAVGLLLLLLGLATTEVGDEAVTALRPWLGSALGEAKLKRSGWGVALG